MSRVAALVLRIFRQFLHDKRTLALMFVAPLVILTLMSLVFDGDPYEPSLLVVDAPTSVTERLEVAGAAVATAVAAEAAKALAAGEVDAALSFAGGSPRVTLEGSDPSKSRAALLLIGEALGGAGASGASFSPEVEYVYGSASSVPFDWFGPVLIGVFAFFFVFLIAGIAFLRERTGGTLERLLVSPLRRGEIVLGYVLGFGVFTLLQAGLIAWFAVDILDMVLVGSFGYVLLITALLALAALTLGVFLSTYAANEFQMIQFIPIVIVPQIFFCGLFPLETIHPALRWISHVIPLTYGADALREVMVRGGGWSDIAVDVSALVGFAFVFMAANALALRKYRKT
ncbi:ABC transporter permease [Paenibacillus antri]|uniref:ABC transporter permease n=1 Tax=Paenibacillus antri TaxID=2582848 RepID=A0A5R9GFJ2_9BACL|nr:ABC transporter permease [Paenibacillus antri]TLS53156.1 ABC transporter permease [Paenibacillus antri]